MRVGLPREGSWRVRYNGDWRGYDPEFSDSFSGDVEPDGVAWDGMPTSGEVSVGPYSAIILSQD